MLTDLRCKGELTSERCAGMQAATCDGGIFSSSCSPWASPVCLSRIVLLLLQLLGSFLLGLGEQCLVLPNRNPAVNVFSASTFLHLQIPSVVSPSLGTDWAPSWLPKLAYFNDTYILGMIFLAEAILWGKPNS